MYIESIKQEEIEKLEYVGFTGETQVIESLGEDYDDALYYLRRQKIIGFDTETRPCFVPAQPGYGVALLQLSGKDKAYLFRLKSIGMPEELQAILSDENIIKVGAAVHDDLRGLMKYGEFKPRSFVDLQKLVGDFGIRDRSVKKMTAIILGYRISKAQQLSNWEAEVLSESQIKYAATDAWVCREMYIKLMHDSVSA